MQVITLPRIGTFDAWRDAARQLAGHHVSADEVTWQLEGEAASLFEAQNAQMPCHPTAQVSVPKAFPTLAKSLCASREGGAFDLAYRLLLRLQGDPRLLSNRADKEVARAESLAKHIRRDMHKMKAFVRFRDVTQQGANRRAFASWFEPDHRIEELIAPFFARRFGDMDWVIVTPQVRIIFDAGDIRFVAEQSERMDLSDETEALWKTYYANIFNPARLKIKAMQSEMPKKYWKNLPEADLIPGLIAKAEAQVQQMRQADPTEAPKRAQRVLDRLHAAQSAPRKGAR